MSYCPTHVHTCYSVRDSVLKLEDYAKKCVEYGITSACITDHGNMHASYKAYKEFKKHDLKAIIGQEFYYAEDRTDKGENYHLVLLAKDNEGFQNLCTLSSLAFTEGFYRKPRIDKSVLRKFSKGVICTTACVFGMAQQFLLNGEFDRAVHEVQCLQSIFGEDLYLEIADHELPDEEVIRDSFRQIGRDFGIKVVPATDSHYLNKEDKEIHNIFKQIAYNSVGTSNDDSFPGTGYHIWTPDEMRAKFPQEEIDVTNEIADKCKIKFEFTGYHLPEFDCPVGRDSYTHLRDLALAGLRLRGLDKIKDYTDRLEYELHQLHLTQLENYFLIVSDYIKWCRENNIATGPGRGSGAGSLVAYLIGITTVDPLQYDLMFARCINPGRALQYDFGV